MKFNKSLFLCLFISLIFHTGAYSFADQLEEGKTAFIKKEYQKAYALLLPLAEGGNTFAQTNVGYMLSQGLGVGKNEKEAIKWYEKAALKGDSNSAYFLDAGVDVPSRRIAWSPSCGSMEKFGENEPQAKTLLSRFHALSGRRQKNPRHPGQTRISQRKTNDRSNPPG